MNRNGTSPQLMRSLSCRVSRDSCCLLLEFLCIPGKWLAETAAPKSLRSFRWQYTIIYVQHLCNGTLQSMRSYWFSKIVVKTLKICTFLTRNRKSGFLSDSLEKRDFRIRHAECVNYCCIPTPSLTGVWLQQRHTSPKRRSPISRQKLSALRFLFSTPCCDQ